jgi:hypothetical protein
MSAAARFEFDWRVKAFVVLWLFVYLPTYFLSYGAWHFLQLCNIAIIVSAVGILTGRCGLISTQALMLFPIAGLWCTDLIFKLCFGEFAFGATAYLWDQTTPVLARALSCYHALWPLLLVYCLRRSGYDHRAWKMQSMLAGLVLAISFWLAPELENLNYLARGWPGQLGFARSPTQVLQYFFCLIFVLYLPTHLLLKRLLPSSTAR